MSNFETQYQSKHPYKTTGTYMTGAGTLIAGITNKLLKIHQYSISAQGTIAYSLNDAKPTGGTVDWGGYLNGGVVASPNPTFVNKPFIPYPGYLCVTLQLGSALCLGTYVTAPVLGTVYFQAIYTDSDAA
jgi:hypothetical protein